MATYSARSPLRYHECVDLQIPDTLISLLPFVLPAFGANLFWPELGEVIGDAAPGL